MQPALARCWKSSAAQRPEKRMPITSRETLATYPRQGKADEANLRGMHFAKRLLGQCRHTVCSRFFVKSRTKTGDARLSRTRIILYRLTPRQHFDCSRHY
jgi:hypothetical protein